MKSNSSELAQFASKRINGLPLTIGILRLQSAKRVAAVQRTESEHNSILSELANRAAAGLPLFEGSDD